MEEWEAQGGREDRRDQKLVRTSGCYFAWSRPSRDDSMGQTELPSTGPRSGGARDGVKGDHVTPHKLRALILWGRGVGPGTLPLNCWGC